jgi:hypothetical protein
MPIRRLSTLLLAASATLVLSGCGSKLDMGKAEQEIADSIQQQTGAKVASVQCPENIEAAKGNTFRCDAKLADGRVAPVKVEQVDDNGSIRYSVEP